MFYALCALFAGLIVAADQATKYLVLTQIPYGGEVPLLPGVVRLTHVHNYGAAFSALQGQKWLFFLVFALFTLVIVLFLWKKWVPFTKLEVLSLAAIYGGGLGNVIDRAARGYVVDMIETEFIRFPVFNVADCFITCGAVLLCVHLLFFNKEFWKKDGPKA